jgi:hypothetical protein
MSDRTVILFHSSNYAMWADDVLRQKEIAHKLIPVPRELSSDCGYCIEFDSNAAAEATKLLTSEKIEFDRIENI